MPFQYPRSIWRGISIRLRQGESVALVSAQTGICQGTLYRWKHQALVDAGMKVGTPSPEAGDLVSARESIRQLEDELAIVKAASALYIRRNGGGAPKRKTAVVNALVAQGFSARRSCLTVGLNRSTYLEHIVVPPKVDAPIVVKQPFDD